MRTHSRILAPVAALVLLAAALACGSGGNNGGVTGNNNPVLTTITVALGATSLTPGATTTAVASGLDQHGASISLGTVAWTSGDPSVATVNSSGVVTAVAAGTVQIIASSSGHSGSATLTVAVVVPVATVTVSPPTVSLVIGTTQQMTAITTSANGQALTGRPVDWSSSNPSVATVSPTGLVQAITAGTATVVATSETKSGSATVTVSTTSGSESCTGSSALELSLGEVRALTPAQIASLCIGAMETASEYVLIPFNNSNVPSATTDLQLTSTGTIAVTTTPNQIAAGGGRLSVNRAVQLGQAMETSFRARERRDVGGTAFASRARVGRTTARSGAHGQLTGVPSNPAVGTVVQLNSNLNGNSCTDAAVPHPARVVAVLPHTIVLIDTLSPTGGYTDAELAGFGAAFDTLGFALDTTNFGLDTDIDGNGRVAIFFTPGINEIPGPVGGVIGGLFAARDLFAATTNGCTASNDGEMFYMPVPDPNQTINSVYKDKTFISELVVPTLVHEFQHLINAGRRIYVNNATDLEEVWLNEGLSHIAEELLYYKESGNTPGENIDLTRIRSSQTQLDTWNNDQSQNFGRLSSYLAATQSNSPFALVDGLAMRGAIWQLLRYSADQKGGDQSATWRALVNATTNGQTNFDGVFGDIITNARNWAVAQFVDDDGLSVPVQYTNPSWNFRNVYSALGNKVFPLATQSLVTGTNVQLSLVGGGAAYVRFGVAAGAVATVGATSANQAVPPNIDVMLVRTK